MANTYSQINLQLVFAVKNRQALIQNQWKERLHTYVTGIIHTNRHKVLQVNSHFNHIHILLNYQNLTQPIPELVEKVKTSSNKFVNDNQLCPFPLRMAKRLRRLFLQPLTSVTSSRLHPKSGETPPKVFIPRRVLGNAD